MTTNKIVDLLFEYELKNDCVCEPSWEKLVTGVLEEIKEIKESKQI